jgi:hypothetical protein
VKTLPVMAAGATPSTLMMVSSTMAPRASGIALPAGRPKRDTAYVANVSATAAIAPEEITSSSVHACRKAGSGP